MPNAISTSSSTHLNTLQGAQALHTLEEDALNKELSFKKYVTAGLITILCTFGLFLGWGMLAKLDKAAIAMGSIVASSNRKTIQHLEGGILQEILVKDGQYVKKGQPVLRIDPLRTKAVVSQLEADHYGRQAQMARLAAERDGKSRITYPADILNAAQTDAGLKSLMAAQDALFRARWDAYTGSITENTQRIEQVKQQISAYESQIASNGNVAALTADELATAEGLLKKGYERLPRVQELRRRVAELQGDVGELRARVAQSREMIAQLNSTIANLKAQRQSEVTNELQQLITAEADYEAQSSAAKDALKRTDLLAPQDGRIVNIRIITVGGVIRPSDPVMDIVPTDDEMVAEVQVKPTDIDSVREGLPAEVRLMAFHQKTTPPVAGKVLSVSADRLVDERTGEGYYKAKVRLEMPATMGKALELYPGMPVEAFINTGSRRAIDYFIEPITQSWRRSFREE